MTLGQHRPSLDVVVTGAMCLTMPAKPCAKKCS